ncbi:ornithine cyclodeaminase [Azorhizobium oxalatiphilum]|uniref:Ornithine cyclodeaminase n=1 Tax=Azorhizobium oxalatiphilum TaxID=980631 RepID=A0A917BUK3_9HYPH|nr:ornithine cyclodeaminase family protein [Azorhizobium oxalatiphilum]GGF57262.1 ornithine cyclodeaminase [Azorhizobium oxalatiphilum]
MMLRMFSAEEIHARLDYRELAEALKQAFAEGGAESPVRQAYEVGLPGAPAHLLTMPSWRRGSVMGVKIVNVFPGNAAQGLGAVNGLFALFDGSTGVPLAIMDSDALTNRRTAAASALASQYLSRPDSRTLLVVGTGHLSAHLAAAHCTVRDIARVLVWGRSAEKAAKSAAKLKAQGLPAEPVTDLAAATPDADIITAATTSTVALVKGCDVRPGTHVDLVGAFTPAMRESDDDLVAKAQVYVDTSAGCLAEAGDLLQAIKSGAWDKAKLRGDLYDLCSGKVTGRTDAEAITLFKSVGAAMEDLVAAELAAADAPLARAS